MHLTQESWQKNDFERQTQDSSWVAQKVNRSDWGRGGATGWHHQEEIDCRFEFVMVYKLDKKTYKEAISNSKERESYMSKGKYSCYIL